MKRLLIVASPVFSAGGGIRHCAAVARAAADAGWQVEMVIGRRPGAPPLTRLVDLAAPACVVREHLGRAGSSLLFTARALLDFLSSTGETRAIYAATPQAMVLGHVLRQSRGRHVRLLVAIQGQIVPDDLPLWKKGLYRPVLRRALRDDDVTVIGVSRWQIERSLAQLGVARRMESCVVLGNTAFETGDAPWVENGHPTGGRRSKTVALVIARLRKEKGVDIAIRALAAARDDIELEIFGDGPERGALHSLALDLGVQDRVRFHGWADPRECLRTAATLVVPSRHEGSPLVLLEAAWASCPIIATSVDGVPEVARELENVVVVPPENPAAVAEALNAACERPRPTAFASRFFTWSAFSQRVAKVLEG